MSKETASQLFIHIEQLDLPSSIETLSSIYSKNSSKIYHHGHPNNFFLSVSLPVSPNGKKNHERGMVYVTQTIRLKDKEQGIRSQKVKGIKLNWFLQNNFSAQQSPCINNSSCFPRISRSFIIYDRHILLLCTRHSISI